MKRFVWMLILLMLIVSGCQEPAAQNWQKEHSVQKGNSSEWNLTPTFQAGHYQMIGIPNKLGALCGEFVEDQAQKCMWHVWGDREKLENASLVIEGVHKESGQKEHLFAATLNYSPNNGADFSMPSNITFSKPGRWRVDVYIDQKLYGSIVVDVKKKN